MAFGYGVLVGAEECSERWRDGSFLVLRVGLGWAKEAGADFLPENFSFGVKLATNRVLVGSD